MRTGAWSQFPFADGCLRPAGRAQRVSSGFAVALCLVTSTTTAGTLQTRDEAFHRLFATDVTIDRHTVFLSTADVERIEALAHAPLEQPRVSYYVVTRADSVVARAYIDTHVVRTRKEVLLLVFDPQGEVVAIEVLAFHEPQDYLPTQRWYQHLARVPNPEQVRPGSDVDAVSGATLSVRAACMALRRSRAIDHTLHPPESP
jgi:hypothetical protein